MKNKFGIYLMALLLIFVFTFASCSLDFLSSELAKAIKNSVQNPQEYIFTSVPRRKKSILKYGIDHAKILSRAVARKLDADYL